MNHNIVIGTYLSYLAISVFLTIWVAQTLSRNGLVFLVEAFHGNRELANSVNHLLVVGFYLVNLVFVSFNLYEEIKPRDGVESIEKLSAKMGIVLIVLGGMHFFNIYIFNRMRNKALLRQQPPPVTPQRTITPPFNPPPIQTGAPVAPAQKITPPLGRVLPQAG